MIYAHSVAGRPKAEWETLEDHACNVSEGARIRAMAFGCDTAAEVLGLLHDIGKIKPGFQAKLAGERNDTPHSAEGAQILYEAGDFARCLAPAIMGHHGRLPNPEKLKRRLATAITLPLPEWLTLPGKLAKLSPPVRVLQDGKLAAYRMQFLVRMLYGCLTDADDRETASFYDRASGKQPVVRDHVLTEVHRAAFDIYMAGLTGTGAVNDIRRHVLQHARQAAASAPGLFTLTVPTGGGKTLTSLGFGLDHALRHGLRRLIYVIPYTSIVEQTADVFRQVLGDSAVLEHHSAANWDGEDESEAEQRKVMGASWDVPVVVTTAVQFFESLYAARKKRCRKLPALARSVIVVDEAQTIPLALLRPCLAALTELTEGYGASVVLSTATQPALTTAGGFPASEALANVREIAPNPPALFAALKRVSVRDLGPLDDTALAVRLRAEAQVLLILDNRMQARALFDAIRDTPGAAHLSTLMTPAHRRAVLGDVRTRLQTGKPVRLVSTSLIEAGVDVDFPLVMRAAAGIDSIAQAAGRCNREGQLDGLGRVELFRAAHPAPPAIEQFAVIGRAVLADHGDDPLGQKAVAAYFRRLWQTYGAEALDAAEVGSTVKSAGILKTIQRAGPNCPYEDIEAAFRFIPGGQKSVIIVDGPWGVGTKRLHEARFSSPGMVAKLMQPHSVNVPYALWHELWQQGLVHWWEADRFDEQFAVLDSSDAYDETAGLGPIDFDAADSAIV